MQPEHDAYDFEQLSQVSQLEAFKPGIKAKLFGLFEKNIDTQLTALQQGIESADVNATRIAAHSIKGVAGSLGARHLSGLADRLERIAAGGSLAEAVDLSSAIRVEYLAAITYLRSWAES